MAQRSSRSSNKKKSKKQPELRTGGGRQAKAARTRAREESGTTATTSGISIRVRPTGVGGVLLMLLMAYIGVALVAALGAWVERWDILSYPDSLWLYAAIGMVAVAPAVGRVARGTSDANAWGAQALLVPLGLFTAESLLGPDCPTGGDCAAVGARGSFGLVGSIIAIVVLAALTLALTRWRTERARRDRPSAGRVRASTAIVTMLASVLFVGGPIALALGGTDILVRKAPSHVRDAREQVALHCFPLGDAPDLAVRAAPSGPSSAWTTYAVRQASESRKGVKGAKLPSDWAGLNGLHPYEATVSVKGDGSVLDPDCRKVSPDAGVAVAADLATDIPEANPIDTITLGSQFFPQFYTQNPPTAEQLETSAKTLADAKKAAAEAAKKDDAPAATDADADAK